MAQTVNVGELPLPQLELLKGQLDQEVEFLSSSIAQLKVVQTKYVEAKDCLNVLNKSNEGKDLLVPLTSSMYVPGKLSDVERVLIDVGTGYYVEKTADDARDFFKRKIDFLTKQMEKIQPALQEKHAMKQGKQLAPSLLGAPLEASPDSPAPFSPCSRGGNDEPEDPAAHGLGSHAGCDHQSLAFSLTGHPPRHRRWDGSRGWREPWGAAQPPTPSWLSLSWFSSASFHPHGAWQHQPPLFVGSILLPRCRIN
uniref:Prefoldin subunit 5 n=2 Tax=Accipitriformes TaxID=2558200 RepID=A0A8B9NPR4_9AVES